jgi:hypothetical protein
LGRWPTDTAAGALLEHHCHNGLLLRGCVAVERPAGGREAEQVARVEPVQNRRHDLSGESGQQRRIQLERCARHNGRARQEEGAQLFGLRLRVRVNPNSNDFELRTSACRWGDFWQDQPRSTLRKRRSSGA